MDLYQEQILHHYKNPQNYGRLDDPTVSVSEANASCGDVVHLDLVIENNTVKEVSFVGEGCAISQAAASMLSEHIKGKSCEDLEKITNDEMFDMLGVPISTGRVKCALLALVGAKKACKHD